MKTISLAEFSPGWFSLSYPFDRSINAVVKEIPGVRFVEQPRKMWIAPFHAIPALEMVGDATGLFDVRVTARLRGYDARIFEGLLAPAKPYQREAAEKLAEHYGFMLAFDMRLGKTYTASVAASHALMTGRARTVLVFCPPGVVGEWQKQFPRWSQGLPIVAVEGTKPWNDQERSALISAPWLALVCHYDLVKYRLDDLVAVLKTRGLFLAIADEAQSIQNVKAGRTKAVFSIAELPNCSGRVALTGTPMRNRSRDLYGPLHFILPGGVGSRSKFTARYCNTPEAPIWMGDFSFKPLGDVRVGDEVIGWSRENKKDATTNFEGRDTLCRARVLDVFRREGVPVVKVTLESGRTIRCTEDHLWLDGSVPGSSQPALSDSPVRARDRAIVKLYESGVPLGLIEELYGLSKQRAWTIATKRRENSYFRPAAVGRPLVFVVDPVPPEIPVGLEHLAGWLGGMYDGEGHQTTISQSSVVNPVTWKRLDDALTALKIPHTMTEDRPHGAGGANIVGGRAGFLRFLQLCKPVRDAGRDRRLLMGRFKTRDRVISIVPDGTAPVIGLKTTTGNYVAWGYASKNCDGHMGDYGWEDDGESNVEELAARLKACSMRLTRRDVAEWLPKSERNVILCDMDPQTAKAYAAQEQAQAPLIARALNGDASGAVQALIELARFTTASKIDSIVERVQHHLNRGAKVLIGSNFHETAQTVEAALLKAQPNVMLRSAGGWKTPAQRSKAIEEWRAWKGPGVLVANYLSSGTGIDLSDAEVCLNTELTWVPADFMQWEARITDVHQGKRTTPPLYEYFLTRGTVDEDMAYKLLKKIGSIERVVGGDSESGHLAKTLKGSDLVERSNLSLNSVDPDDVRAAIDRMRDRIMGKRSATDLDKYERLKTAIDFTEAFSDDEEVTDDGA